MKEGSRKSRILKREGSDNVQDEAAKRKKQGMSIYFSEFLVTAFFATRENEKVRVEREKRDTEKKPAEC